MKETKYYNRVLSPSGLKTNEISNKFTQNKLFFYPLDTDSPSNTHKNMGIDILTTNYSYNSKSKLDKMHFSGDLNTNTKPNKVTQDIVLLSPRNRVRKNSKNVTSVQYDDRNLQKSSTTSKLNVLEMTTVPKDYREAKLNKNNNKIYVKELFSFNNKNNVNSDQKQISESIRSKLNNIYDLAGEEIG